jgi:phosphate transport system substrate-binding protein
MRLDADVRCPLYVGRRDVLRALSLTALGLTALDLAVTGTLAARQLQLPPGPDASVVRFVDSLPLYVPDGKASGRISLWGHGSFKHDFLGKLLHTWIEGFRRYQEDVVFENRMYGTASAIGALYTGAGNLAILGEEIHPDAALAFQRAKGYPPTQFQIATGSLDVNFFDYAHMIFVHAGNPIGRLTVAQLEAIFGTEHKRSAHNIRTWDQLGLTGDWHGRRIQPYSWKTDEDFGLFFRGAVLGGSHRWNVEVKEFVHTTRPDGSLYEHGAQILDTLAHDPFGIAISNVRFANSQVKALALAGRGSGPYYQATQANLISQKFPLTRIIPACIDRAPGEPVDPKLREFLRYVLSREGQRALLTDSGYLPLGTDAILQQREKLV